MKIIIAPDSFKGSLSALEVCEAASRGIASVSGDIEVVTVPMADGGEGTVQSLVDATGGRLVTARVKGPLGKPVQATYGILGDGVTAVIEMAAASGLPLVPPGERNPEHTTTYGTGELIKAALDAGAKKLIVGLGGSATTDGGLGMAAALGAKLLDKGGLPIVRKGLGMGSLETIDVKRFDSRVAAADIRVACDVDNPLYGPNGAAHVYGPQKGATPKIVADLDRGLRRVAEVVKRDLRKDVAEMPGAGAAGGLGAGLVAFCGARLERGVKIVIDTVGLREKMQGCDLCLTGEGRIDFQTAFGKTPKGVADVAAEAGVPVVAFGGAVATDAPNLQEIFAATFCICNQPLSLQEAMRPETARELIAFTAQQIVRCYLAAKS